MSDLNIIAYILQFLDVLQFVHKSFAQLYISDFLRNPRFMNCLLYHISMLCQFKVPSCKM
jgi:hypothetical protein